MKSEILGNNLEVISDVEIFSLNIINEMFGEQTVTEIESLASVWSEAISKVDWNRVGVYGGVGAAAGFALGILLSKIYIDAETQRDSLNTNPDPAHGCGCTLVTIGTVAGLVAGVVVGRYTQPR
ncbi:MAG: hypothetical protein RBT33_01800 [Candidatus Dojkabacteria bacterium]|nr:hypothetical protein [Candidatus Dojkabacteria bacterium]